MFAAWLVYALLVSFLLALGVRGIEGALTRLGMATRWAWVGGLVLLPILLLAPLGIGSGSAAPSGEVGTYGVHLGPVEVVQGMGSRALESVPAMVSTLGPERLAHLESMALGLWALLSALLLLRAGAGFFQLRAARRGWSQIRLPEGEVHLSEDVGPGVFGIFRNGVVLPRWCLEFGSHERGLILAHEEEHRRSRDTLTVATAALSVIALPWNPAVWWMWHRLRSAVEIDCDRRVTRARPDDRRLYGYLLLMVGARRGGLPTPLATFSQHPDTLSRRIQMLTRHSRPYDLPRSLLLATFGIVVIAVACIIPGPDRTDGLVDPMEDSATETEAELSTLASTPQFTPHTEAPQIRNMPWVARTIERLYPAEFRDAGVGARVVLHIFIDEQGTVRNAKIAESSGEEEFDRAGLEVVRGMEFDPARNDGVDVPVWVQFPVSFQSGGTGESPAPATPAEDDERRTTIITRDDGPHFTPHDQAPRVRNAAEVSSLLSDAYPSELRDAGVGGTVLLMLFIDEQGVVRDAEMAEGSGNATLDQVALEVVGGFEFEPARNRGESVPVWIQMPVRFTAS